MRTTLAVALGVVFAYALQGCNDQGGVSAEGCSSDGTITFQGRAYTPGFDVLGLDAADEKGKRLGLGELLTCGDGDGAPVEVFKVVGVEVRRAVYVEPPYGAMRRADPDER